MSSNPTWDAHWATLTEHERHLFETDEHPSLSWDFAPRAAEYVTELRQQLAALDYVERVSLDFYHGDTLVLTVHLSRDVPSHVQSQHIPELFRGFQVFVAPRRTLQ